MPLHPFNGVLPRVHDTAFVAPGAQVIGDVTIGADSSIWYNCVLRGDVQRITIGARSNIQDGSVLHVTTGTHHTEIHNDVLVGHLAIIHGAILESRSFVGLGSIVMDGCVLEPDAMLAAGALLTPGKRIATGQLWAGRPARHLRDMAEEEIIRNRRGAASYVEVARQHRASLV
ncbi:gamma carbonic anhydrase family protein [Polymorphobacter sp.]|uniref:gamma carbonic anhydrase family protein n=1 Tax=Polymorphobacter sp. TaxID=1909290 RepID=UPI003F715C1A